MSPKDMTYADWKRAEKEYNLRKETEKFEMEPFWVDLIWFVGVLTAFVASAWCYVEALMWWIHHGR